MKQKILVIDDEPLMLKSTCMALKFRGFETNGINESTRGICTAMTYNPDLILLDIMMPVMDGWQVLELLKAEPVTAGIPVIIFTAKEYSNGPAVARSRGAVDLIAKPFELDELVQLLQQYTGTRGNPDE